MQMELAILSVVILLFNFGAEKLIKHLSRRAKEAKPADGETEAARNLRAVRKRNKRLGWLSLVSLVLLLFLQSININDALSNRKKDKMKDLENRVIKIEKFLWGNNDGSPPSDEPSDPDGCAGYVKTLEERIAQLTKRLEALGYSVTEVTETMSVRIPAQAAIERSV